MGKESRARAGEVVEGLRRAAKGMHGKWLRIRYQHGEIIEIKTSLWMDQHGCLTFVTDTFFRCIPHNSLIDYDVFEKIGDNEEAN